MALDGAFLACLRQEIWDSLPAARIDKIHQPGREELVIAPYIPVQYFTGMYKVETVPYNPPDPTFALGTRMSISTDDDFAPSATTIPYPFYFFGIRKTGFVLGLNL